MSNKIKKTKLGFTVIELIIVISIVGMVASASFAMFGENRKKAVLDDSQASVINALEEAQNRAATGFGTTTTTKHGVWITTNGFAICGDTTSTCASSTQFTNVTTNWPDLFISFNRLNGKPNTASEIILVNPSGSMYITVTEGGLILPR